MGTERWMIDIETIGKGRRAAILSIGYVRFGPDGPRLETACEFRPRLGEQLERLDRDVDASTIIWWLEQTARPWQDDLPTTPCEEIIHHMHNHMGKADEIWAKPPQFDLAIINSLCEDCNLDTPWHWRKERCFRTVKAFAPAHCHLPPLPDGEKHGALADAIHQASEAALMLKWLNGEGTV